MRAFLVAGAAFTLALSVAAKPLPSQDELGFVAECAAQMDYISGNPAFAGEAVMIMTSRMTVMAISVYGSEFDTPLSQNEHFVAARASSLQRLRDEAPQPAKLLLSKSYNACGDWKSKVMRDASAAAGAKKASPP